MSASPAPAALMIDIAVICLWIAGIRLFRSPRGARFGNAAAALAMLSAFCLVLYRHGLADPAMVLAVLLLGAAMGYGVARVVTMVQIPALVAVQNGMGGMASMLVALVQLTRGGGLIDPMNAVAGIIGLTLGALTFSGSMVAAGKLTGLMGQTPRQLPAHQALLLMNLVGLLAVGTAAPLLTADARVLLLIAQVVLAGIFGLLFAVRVGGADMPVLISFLNATTGLAAAFCGIVIENRLLIAFGTTVGASGSILTYAMCTAMNRSLINVFAPRRTSTQEAAAAGADRGEPPGQAAPPAGGKEAAPAPDPFSRAVDILASAGNIVIVPGYGMALAQAQAQVVALADQLAAMGKAVKYAIHPVAGRMPGHMNVLLADAGVDYDLLAEMDQVNPELVQTDAVLIFGACDVVNPAAIESEATPISGMPILMVHEAGAIIVCNLDTKPGYSGVENPLYENPKAILLLGDAKQTAADLLAAIMDRA